MKAAVLHQLGMVPTVEEFADPIPTVKQPIVQVLAAALNPVDLAIASGQLPFRPIQPPCVAGFEGVGELEDGQRVYFSGPPPPYGSLAELAPVPEGEAMTVPAGLDPAVAAVFGVSGLAAWLALEHRGRLAHGETVLVLGASGIVGQIAVQAARLLGAGRIVAAARGTKFVETARTQGADATVALDDPDPLTERLRAAAPDGYDVITDLVWGDAITPALEAAAHGARLVQVGNANASTASIAAPSFRNKLVSIVGHTNFLTPREIQRTAFARLTAHALAGQLRMEPEQIPLDEVANAWNRLHEGGLHHKLVVTP